MAADPALLHRLADLAVGFGANLQPGQVLAVGSELGKEELTRAIAASAYRRGARFVDVAYFDLHLKRARVEHADPDTLEYVPSWYGERLLALGEQRCARIGLSGQVAPGLLDDLDPERVGRDQLPFLKESGKVVNDRTTNWTIVPCPTPAWARLVHPDLDEDGALAKLWSEVERMLRLDEDDPEAAWTARMDTLVGAADRLTARRFDALRLRGPGTDLTVGLLPSSRWLAARFETVDGLEHRPNLPSEETFTTPDPGRTEGVVRCTRPLMLSGTVVDGLELRFGRGRLTGLTAERGEGVARALFAKDEGAGRLGEVALVDGEGRIGPLGTVFYDTLIDENAASHIALGNAYAMGLEDDADVARMNDSAIHVDVMVGSDDLEVLGVTAGGEEVPVLVRGRWQV